MFIHYLSPFASNTFVPGFTDKV